MHLVETYWAGVQRRLQAEVEGFNSLISHQGEKGRENELSFARLLSRLVPARYGVGSGLIFDTSGEESTQTDIVLFDAIDEPAVMAQTNQVLFPVENVRAAIEVKTAVGKDEIEDIGEKTESVQSLSPSGGFSSPLTMAVGYKARVQPATLASHLLTLGERCRPDIVLVLSPAIVGFSKEVVGNLGMDAGDSDYFVGAVPVQIRDDDGRALRGDFAKPHGDTTTREEFRGTSYPVHVTDAGPYLAESARALLLVAEALTTSLAVRDGRNPPGFHHYLTDVMRDCLSLT